MTAKQKKETIELIANSFEARENTQVLFDQEAFKIIVSCKDKDTEFKLSEFAGKLDELNARISELEKK